MYKSIILALLAAVMVSFGGCRGASESEYLKLLSERETLKSELTSLKANVASLKRENNLLRNELEEQKQEVARLMAGAASRQVETKEATPKEPPFSYEVKSGDSLWSIARQFQTSVATIKKLNNLDNSNIRIGQKILLR